MILPTKKMGRGKANVFLSLKYAAVLLNLV